MTPTDPPEPMTASQFAAAKERCARATPGPWEWDGDVWNYDREQEAPWLVGRDTKRVLHGEIEATHEGDADFIAHARQDLEAALAWIDAILPLLREVIDNGDDTTGEVAALLAGWPAATTNPKEDSP